MSEEANFAAVPVKPARKERMSNAAIVSIAMHAGVLVLAIFPMGFMNSSTPRWGEAGNGGGVATPVNLTASIPLPPSPVESKLATDTKSENLPEPVVKPTPKAKAPDPPPRPDDYLMNSKLSKQARQDQAKKDLLAELKIDRKQADNVVPGSGSRASSPLYGAPQSTGGGANMSFGGDFGSRYGLYVRSVHECISRHWDRTRIDSVARDIPKAFVDFDILRDGTISGEKIATSSGVRSFDAEALRSIQACSGRAGSDAHLPALPRDFEGSRIPVEVWFDSK